MTIQTHTLTNGMQVLLEESYAARVVSFNILVKVGSANETDAEAGMSHLIEHMLFKGTPTRPTGTIARDVEAAGGEINAYTSLDQTVYYINMASQFASAGLEILADAVQHPLFDADELAREKEVVLEEVRREQDNPSRMAVEYLFEHAYRRHPYGRPIIGFPKTVRSFTRDTVLSFFRKWYTPQNIVLVAIGDFSAKKMLAQIERCFADFRGPAAPAHQPPAEPAQAKAKLALHPMNIQSTYLTMGYHIPEIAHEDVPAIDVLSHILGGTDSSRLEQEIKERRHLVHNIYAYAFTPKDPGLFVVGATLADRDAAKAVEAIRREIARVRELPVTSEELARAKLAIRSQEIYDKETVGGQAAKLVSFIATTGREDFEKRYYQILADVRAEQVLEVARRYLVPTNCTGVFVVPERSKWVRQEAPLEKTLTKAPKAAAAATPAPEAKPTPRRVRLKNGVSLVLLENHTHPIVSICAAALGGVRSETKRTNGISVLTARLLTKGTTARSAIDIAREIEDIAGSIDGFSGRNTMGLKAEFLSEHLRQGFALFADVLTHPAFDPKEVEKEKQLQRKAIRDQEDALSSLAFIEFLKALYPKHPYGLRALGSRESVKRLTRIAVRRHHRDLLRAKNLVITIAGDFNPKEVQALAEENLADLPRGAAKRLKLKDDPRPAKPRTSEVVKKAKQQAHIVLGYRGIALNSADRFAMAVLNNILAGQGGRLFRELRDRMSLAYAVSSVNQTGIEPGYIAVYIGTEPGKVETAIGGIHQELGRVRDEPVTAEELERSKQYLVGTYELDAQRTGALAGIHTFNELYGLGLKEFERYPERILRVTRQDVQRVAKKYIRPEATTLAVVKPD